MGKKKNNKKRSNNNRKRVTAQMNQICLRPPQLYSGFPRKPIRFFLCFKKIFWIPVFVVGSLMGENLKIDF
jgi:hypothetical protein